MVSDSVASASPGKRRGPVRKARRIPRDPVPLLAQLPDSKQDGGEWPPAQGPCTAPLSPAGTNALPRQSSSAEEEREGVVHRPAVISAHLCAPSGAAGPSALSLGQFRQAPGAPLVHPSSSGFAERVVHSYGQGASLWPREAPGPHEAPVQGQFGPAAGPGYETLRTHLWPAAPLWPAPLSPATGVRGEFVPAPSWPGTEQSRETPAHAPAGEQPRAELPATGWPRGATLRNPGPGSEGGQSLPEADGAPAQHPEPLLTGAGPESGGMSSGPSAWRERRDASSAAERARRATWSQRSVYLQRGSGLVYPIDSMFGEGGVASFARRMAGALSDASSVTSADTVLSRPPLSGAHPGPPFLNSSARTARSALSFDHASDSLSAFSFVSADGGRRAMSYQDDQSRDYSYRGPSPNASAPSRFWEMASLAAGAAVVVAGTATIIGRSRDRGRRGGSGSGGGNGNNSASAEGSGSRDIHDSAREEVPQATKEGAAGVPPGVVHGQEFIDDERPHLHRGCEGTFELFFRQQPAEDIPPIEGALASLKLEPFEEPGKPGGPEPSGTPAATPPSMHDKSKILLGTSEGAERYCDLTKGLPCTDVSQPGSSIRGPGVIYEVQPGDTLCGIASRHGKAWNDVAGNNPHIQNPNRIYPKDRLLL